MKTTLFIALLYLPLVAFSQIIFEEITTPEDFSLSAIRKSPTGEYFAQASHDRYSIYTSLDGENWTKTALPVDHRLDEIDFFSDGTPLLKGDQYSEHLIRRAGVWYDMNITSSWGAVEASFIKGDSLFGYQDNTFAYSLNKGLSFTTVFTATENIVDHSANLWKFDNHFVLHHTAGASDYVSIFDEDGVRVFFQSLSISGIPTITYRDCGGILICNNNNYQLITDHAPWVEQGITSDIIPEFSNSDNLFSRNDHYYHRRGDTVYKTGACDFNWEVFTIIDAAEYQEAIWISEQEDIFLNNPRSNRFIEYLVGSNQWEEQLINIDYALVGRVNESLLGHQVLLTPNKLFNKDVGAANWGLLNVSDIVGYQAQYSPNGSLYLKRSDDILVSSDNGEHFTSIELPEGGILNTYSSMKILDDNFIFLYGGIITPSFYTRNNGLDWIPINVSSIHSFLDVKLVNNHIFIVEDQFHYTVTRINLATNETTSENLGYFNFSLYEGLAIQDDGTIYFVGQPSDGAGTEGLYRYQFGEPVEFIAATDELGDFLSLMASGNDLFLFRHNSCDLFDGDGFTASNYIGLPSGGYRSVTLSDNEHIYVLVDEHRVFRSTTPLSVPQFITGTVYHESNGDCLLDNTDATLSNWQIKVESDAYFRIKRTDSQGRFSFSVPNGEYTISTQPVNTNWSLCESSFTVAIDDNATVNQDMMAQGLVDCAALELDFSTPLLRRCFDNYYSVRIRNTGPISSAGTVLRLELDPFFDFSSASIPYVQMGDILEFDLGVLAVNDQIVFTIFFNLSCDADLGAEHCLSGLLIDANLCPETTTATYKECQVNIGSFDPNDKRIFNEAGYEVETVDKDQYIYYHIRFQNTGTDTAFTVRILDSLSSTLDLNTLEMLSASHPYDFTIKDGPALEVIFENILLPDSTTNEVASHGFVKFKVKPLPAFDYGTTIPNQAGIYFDFNQPVITNEAVLVIQRPVSTKEAAALIAFSVFPNPTDNTLSLRMTETDRSRIDAYEIINQLGQPMSLAKHLTGNHIAVSHLPSGVYHLALKENGVVIGREKFIKL